MAFLTNGQARYLAELYTGTEVPELHCTWPRFSDGERVKVGSTVASALGAMEVGSVQFYSGYVMFYDTSHWHYVKLYDGQTAERP